MVFIGTRCGGGDGRALSSRGGAAVPDEWREERCWPSAFEESCGRRVEEAPAPLPGVVVDVDGRPDRLPVVTVRLPLTAAFTSLRAAWRPAVRSIVASFLGVGGKAKISSVLG
jgi:hypothetical protein